MALDLKPLTEEVIQQLGLGDHDLWLVKHDDEIFGPFEVESLKHYATENEPLFEKAVATRMDANNWQPFFSYDVFHLIAENAHPERRAEEFWILHLGQKAGPYSRRDIDKKMELGLLTLADMVSLDNGETWKKFYQLDAFNSHTGNPDELPMAPLESSFQRAKEVVNEWVDTHEVTGSHSGLAGLVFIAQHKDKSSLNLDEMDLKSLSETEVSRSLKWAVPSAVAGFALLAAVGNYLLSPSNSMDEVADVKDAKVKPEVIMPKVSGTQQTPSLHRPRLREPSSFNPPRSNLTRPTIHHADNSYPSQVETHRYEPDPMIDPVEAEVLPPPDQTTEHSLVSNQAPQTLPHEGTGESLDQAMGGAVENPMPEQPVIEEAADF